MNSLVGGENCCICGCRPGQSPSNANYDANIAGGYIPSDGGGGSGGGSYA